LTKLLLDENLPFRLKYRFEASLEVSTVSDQGWNSIKDGELLKLMKSHRFDILITSDKHLKYQQNLEKHGIVVILLLAKNNRYHFLRDLIPDIETLLPPDIGHGVVEIALG